MNNEFKGDFLNTKNMISAAILIFLILGIIIGLIL